MAGYPTYVPATLLIKAVMGLAAGTAVQPAADSRGWGALVCGIVGEIPMVVGYWLYDALLVGQSGSGGAPPGFPPIWSRPCSAWRCPPCWLLALRRSGYVRREFPGCENVKSRTERIDRSVRFFAIDSN